MAQKPSNKKDKQPAKLIESPGRRMMLKLLGLSSSLIGLNSFTSNKESSNIFLELADDFNDTINLTIYRPNDFLELNLTFVGFKKGGGNFLVKSSTPNLLIVEFPPQSIAEQAYEEISTNKLNDIDSKAFGVITPLQNDNLKLPAKTYISGKSRLVFEIPSTIGNISLDAPSLLNWDAYKLVTNKRAVAPNSFPAFNAKDNMGDFENGLLENDVLKSNPKLQTTPQNNNSPNKETIKDRLLNLPVKVKTNTDTVARDLNLNKVLRGATKNEQIQIEQQQSPIQLNKNSNITAAAAFAFGKSPRPIPEDETAIEMPYRLFISPNQFGMWDHDTKLKLREDLQNNSIKTYALWHTQLTCKNCDNQKDKAKAIQSLKTIRALWAVDANGAWDKKPKRDNSFKTALFNDDRHCIVHESSNWDLKEKKGFTPVPAQVNNLMLTTLGAWLDAEMLVKRIDLDKSGLLGSLNLLKWKHIATLARDHYVEIVYAGNIMPFGHEASLVRITERKPRNNYAVNFQRFFIAINETEKKYNPIDSENQYTKFPFSTIKFSTTATPTIDDPKTFCTSVTDKQPDKQFIPFVDGKPFNFKIIGYDLDGNEVNFSMPLVFVSTNLTTNSEGQIDAVSNLALTLCYNSNSILGKNKVNLNSQKLSLARSKTPGDTTFEISTVVFNAKATNLVKPGFIPIVHEIDLYVNAIENLTGQKEVHSVALVDDRNKGNIFAEFLKKSAVGFSQSGSKMGGAINPDFSVTALSKTLGAVGGLVDDVKNMNFKPNQFFDGISAKLFGVFDLASIIAKAENATANLVEDKVHSQFPALKTIETNDSIITQYIWNKARLTEKTIKIATFKPRNNNEGNIVIETNLHRNKKDNTPGLLTVESRIDNFDIIIADIVKVQFNRIGFKTGTNAKVDFTVDMAKDPIKFLGMLSFVNDLQKYIPADGFSDPPYLDISMSGVTAGYTLSLPDLQVGVFSLRHLKLSAEVNLPFSGEPLNIRFAFCERQQPFTLTVGILGGGGFFAIKFNTGGIQQIEAALEFGAAASLNLGVASGAVSIMGGIYFSILGDSIRLQGYIRVNGALTVLSLVAVTVEFLMSLNTDTIKVNNETKVSRVWGQASVKVKVEVFMFSKTVTLQTSREFAGAGADPNFGMMINKKQWIDEYCAAFETP